MFRFPTALLLTALVASVLTAAACTPITATRGNLLSETRLAAIQPGQSSRADVTQQWGPPTTVAPFDNNVWYYIGETTEQKGIFEAEVTKRQMVRVTFGPDDMVERIAGIDPKDGREIAFVDRKTSTAGKEFTAFQQFVGNLGKFNSDTVGANRPQGTNN
jgi:outer membrane protein assembly factor BamE (lipoprotein component of BamABCDE complex)